MNTSAIKLRALEPEDLDTLYVVENDKRLWTVGITNEPYSRHLLRHFIATQTGDIYADRQVRLMIENAAGTVVGMADITDFNPQHRRADVGIVILPDHRRQGYATETLVRLTRYAADTLHIHQLNACVAADNAPSVALFTKAGFRQAARLIDWLYDGTRYHDALLMQWVAS